MLQENLALLLDGSEESEFTPQDILNALLYAAANRTSIEQAATQLATGTHPNTVRLRIAKLELAELETQINAGLRSRLPPKFFNIPRKIAIDLTFIPYYGQATEENQEFIIRGEAKAGTTRFFAYATLVCHPREQAIYPRTALRTAGRYSAWTSFESSWNNSGGWEARCNASTSIAVSIR